MQIIFTLINVSLVLFQACCVVIIAWFFALDKMHGAWDSFGALPYFVPYLLSLATGIILIIIHAIARKKAACITLIISTTISFIFLFIPILGIQGLIVHALEPFAKKQIDKKYENDQKNYVDKKQNDYNELRMFFSQPRKIIKANGSLILLEDLKVIAIRGVEHPQNNPDFDRFLNDSVVGNLVTVDIGSWEHFSRHYIPGGINNFVQDLRTGLSLQDQFKLPFYACIPADVYLNGQSLGDKGNLTWWGD